MSDIVLKDRQGTKQTYSGVEMIKIADSEGNYNNYVAEPTGEIEITANGSVDVSKYARAMVAVPGGSVEEWDGTGVVIAPITPEAQPSITINGATYNVVQGMTWFTWASNLDYNTDNFRCLNVDSKVFVAESEDYVIDSDGNAVYGEDLITVGGVYSIEEPPITEDELAGTWVFNNTVNIPDYARDWTLNFQCNGVQYTLLSAHNIQLAMPIVAVLYDGSNVYEPSTGWYKQYYKIITITSKLSEVTDGSTLLTFLKANATKQGATSLITFTIDGTSYQAESGMTWAEWCESDYNTGDYRLNGIWINKGGNGSSYVANSSGTFVTTSDTIISGHPYSMKSSGEPA